MTQDNLINELIIKIENEYNVFSDIILKEWEKNIWIKSKWLIKQLWIWTAINISSIKDYVNSTIDHWYNILLEEKSIDYQTKTAKNKLRINVSFSNWKVLLVIRRLSQEIIPINDLWINISFLKNLLNKDKGIFFVSWRTWSWKSTTLASIINYFNKNTHKHIITLENPIETEFLNHKCIINQKELYKDFDNFDRALEDWLREAPDIFMIWEIRNREVLKRALEFANSWHLVLSTIHWNNAQSVIWKIIRSGENEREILWELADALIWILHQELFYHNSKPILIAETLYNNTKVRAWLLNWRYDSITSIIQTSLEDWMITHAQYLENELLNKGIIDPEKFKELIIKYKW